MTPLQKSNVNRLVGSGILLQFAEFFLRKEYNISPLISYTIATFALILIVLGCAKYAEGKGHSKWFGFLGVLSFIVLFLMSDNQKK